MEPHVGRARVLHPSVRASTPIMVPDARSAPFGSKIQRRHSDDCVSPASHRVVRPQPPLSLREGPNILRGYLCDESSRRPILLLDKKEYVTELIERNLDCNSAYIFESVDSAFQQWVSG